MMKKFILGSEDMQSLKNSLLAFVSRVAFHGTQFEEEAGAFFPVVSLLLGIPVALELHLDDMSGTQEEEPESNVSQDSEHCGACRAHGYQHIVGCRRRHSLV